MQSFIQIALVAMATLYTTIRAAPVIKVHPGNANDIVIIEQDTVNATNPAPVNSTVKHQILATEQLPLALVNNFPGGGINAYVTGLDSNNALVMLQPNGQFYYPTASAGNGVPQLITGDVAIPLGAQGSTLNINLPGYISAARIWFAEGDLQFFTVWNPATNAPSLVEPSAVNPSDPSAGVNWGFVELTNTEDGGLYANLSYVDFVGLILGMEMTAGDGSTQNCEGLQANAVSSICSSLQAQGAKDGQAWGDLCQVSSSGTPLRILAPTDYMSVSNSAFENYWTDYINQVWSQYETNTLTIDTQAAAGQVACTVQNGLLTCDGDNRGYAQPTASDIFGCNSGPFAIEAGDNAVHYAVVPRLCAAFHRSTLLLNGGNLQPSLQSENYYTTAPTNWYSYFVHQQEVDAKGYAFSYDDVTPTGAVNSAGVVSDASPQLLKIIVGGPLS